MKTFYTCTASFSIPVDPAQPDSITRAAAWMTKMMAGQVEPPPEGVDLTVEIKKAPSIVNRKEGKADNA